MKIRATNAVGRGFSSEVRLFFTILKARWARAFHRLVVAPAPWINPSPDHLFA
jgi:hypothetical protein